MAVADRAFPFGVFMSLPDAVDAGQGQWRASVSISASPVGASGTSAKKCEFPQSFPSREAALQYATEQCRIKASQNSLRH